MKRLTQTRSRNRRARAAGMPRPAILVVVESAPVRFAVSIRPAPVSFSAWRSSIGTAPASGDSTGCGSPSLRRNPGLRFHEPPAATAAQSTPAADSRIGSPRSPAACGTAVSRRGEQTCADAGRVATGGTGPGAQTRKRWPVNGSGADRFQRVAVVPDRAGEDRSRLPAANILEGFVCRKGKP